MFAQFPRTRTQRRGIVLVLVLAMMGLLALIGVTFATFSGQARVNARNFSQSQNWPDSAEVMDFALSQLIDDTDNPQSAIRGHSLKRDMYGNDALFNSLLTLNPSTGNSFMFKTPALVTTATNVDVFEIDGSLKTVNVFGLYRCETNISAGDPYFYGYNFTRWLMRFRGLPVAGTPITYNVGQSHEILVDSRNDSSGFRVFYVAPWDSSYATPTSFPAPPPTTPTATVELTQPTMLETPIKYDLSPYIPYPLPGTFTSTTPDPPPSPLPYYNNNNANTPAQSTLIGLPPATEFVLDGRFLHAFNGPGMSALDWVLSTVPAARQPQYRNRGVAQYANFRYNGNIVHNGINRNTPNSTPSYGFPNNLPGMDEDYDACDLENWFLAMQSADGQVMIPSFHRPGILVRQKDQNQNVIFDDWTQLDIFSMSKILRPRAADGHSAVAFPNLYPDTNGKVTYDVDNDGDGTTDSVWVDLGYPPKRSAEGTLYKPLFAFMIVGLNGRIPLNTAGNLQLRNVLGIPANMHASGKGYSPSELDPSYALQNAFSKTAGYTQVDNAGFNTAYQYDTVNGFRPGDDSTTLVSNMYAPFAPPWGTSGVPVSLTQLRNILAGTRTQNIVNGTPLNGDANYVLVNNAPVALPNGVFDQADIGTGTPPVVQTETPTVAGRWGESEDLPIALAVPALAFAPGRLPPYVYTNPVRAGLSGQLASGVNPRFADGRDDDNTTFDSFPKNTSTTGPLNALNELITTLGESPVPVTTTTVPNYGGLRAAVNADYFDASGSIVLPVERIRRFVTPIDVAGDGLVTSYSTPSPAVADPTPLNNETMPALLGSDDKGRVAFFKHFRPPGLAVATSPGIHLNPPPTKPKYFWFPYTTANPGNEILTPLDPDRTNNIYHGYEAYRHPALPASPPPGLTTQHMGAMLHKAGNNTPALGAITPTYDQHINTDLMSASLNEADEMRLYTPSRFDDPFGPSDLEWLYRQQDTDGTALNSRLKDLAPISFNNPLDGIRRRRLFSIESWEPTNFILAHDTPLNDPQINNVDKLTNTLVKPNSRFAASASANFSNLSGSQQTPFGIPAVAHRDRKINLNFPLPVSNRYDEPVRQKWVRETYQLLKEILPPNAVDTPEELAQLSQFVVNIIDFRDPDATATRFVNTDVYYSAKATAGATGTPAVLSFTKANPALAAQLLVAPGAPALLDQATLAALGIGPPFNATSVALPPPYSPLYDNQNSPYVVQYGMEYNPVAINEVLAYQFTKASGGPVKRMWIELLNTLTKPGTPLDATKPGLANDKACDLELDGWDFVILPDDNSGRPDPITGQLPYTGLPVKGITVSGKDITEYNTATMPTDPGGLPATKLLEALDPNGTQHPYLFVSSPNGSYTAADENNEPTNPDQTIDLIGLTELNAAAITANTYYWLYLRRPANPFDTSYDPYRPNENRVVVDCFRFIFHNAASGSAVAGGVYSLERVQPFRGGEAVKPIPPVAGAADFCISAYGYSNQTAPSLKDRSGTFEAIENATGPVSATKAIYDSLGKKSESNDDFWEFMPFNDRDFTSVAELLLVPGCPPGLFTKQFVELPPPIDFASSGSYKKPAAGPPAVGDKPYPPTLFQAATKEDKAFVTGSPPTLAETSQPRTFPYLVDKFFYTPQTEPMIYMGGPAIVPPGNRTMFPGEYPTPPQTPVYWGVWPDPGNGPAPIKTDPTFYPPVTGTSYAKFPIVTTDAVGTAPNFDYYRYSPGTNSTPYPSYIGGPSNAGWYKMFEFFDVPSPAYGSIGPVAEGSNYDWARQDLKPGLLNINLIIDEEVFFALMSESWLKTLNFTYSLDTGADVLISPNQTEMDNMGATRLDVRQIPAVMPVVPNANATPIVVTEVGQDGSPTAYYNMPNKGFTALDPVQSALPAATGAVFDNRMKAAFSDFLKLRHGGSGYMFAYQYGSVGDPNPYPNNTLPNAPVVNPTTILASERPFRSLGYPDVNATVLRPAALPPTLSTVLRPYLPSFTAWGAKTVSPDLDGGTAPYNTYVGDPGVKNPYLFTQNSPVQSPPIPVRRLFEVPDVWGHLRYPGGTGTTRPPSNASSKASAYPVPSAAAPVGYTGDANVNWQNLGPVQWTPGTTPVANAILANTTVDLSAIPTLNPTTAGTTPYVVGGAFPPPYGIVPNFYLGANTAGTGGSAVKDNRQHPYYRYEWLQKVMNLTTVRTHQYAVWITVGFFQVTQSGDASLGSGPKWNLAYDRLGQELNIQNGKNIRYRSFFIIDRTRAVGFSPQAPGNFRDCIVYRQSIE